MQAAVERVRQGGHLETSQIREKRERLKERKTMSVFRERTPRERMLLAKEEEKRRGRN